MADLISCEYQILEWAYPSLAFVVKMAEVVSNAFFCDNCQTFGFALVAESGWLKKVSSESV